MRKTLSDKGVAALKARASRYSFADPELRGLYVRVQPSGAKSFVVVSRDPYGKQIWHTVGRCDALRINEARDLARDARKRIPQGLPAIEPPPVKPDSFRSVAENWLKRHVEKEKLRSQYEIKRCLNKYVLPHWQHRDFVSIKRSDVAALLDQIEDQHGPRMADLVLALMRSIANWFASRDDNYVSPFVRGMRRHTKPARSRVLDDSELRRVWKQAEDNGGFGALIRVLLLTGQRRGAVLRMCWDDLSADGIWEIPIENRAKGNAGSLQLPTQARTIINGQPRLGSNPHVFAASRGNGSMKGLSHAKLAFDKTCGVKGWTLHDLRRTARSLLSRADVRPDIAERVLGHTIGGVEGIYDRHRYDAEKAAALARLAALIDGIVNPRDNVSVMQRKKTR